MRTPVAPCAWTTNTAMPFPAHITNLAHSRCAPAASVQRWRRSLALKASDRDVGGLATSVFKVLPKELLPVDGQKQGSDGAEDARTVYCIRFTTGYARGAALSDPNSGVSVLLVGKDGRAILKRISPVNDPEQTMRELSEMCQNLDESVGANCGTIIPTSTPPPYSAQTPGVLSSGQAAAAGTGAAKQSGETAGGAALTPWARQAPPPLYSRPSPSGAKPRFQEGHVDEVSFLAPELGPLAGMLVGTESGSWLLDEVDVASSRTSHIDRFVCRDKLGVKAGLGAAWLTPVPSGSVIYGTGESAVLLSKDEATSLRASNLAEYEGLKSRLLLATVVLAAGGSGLVGLVAGANAAVPFALGGAAGTMYQWLLQQGVDGLLQKGTGSRATPTPAAAVAAVNAPPAAAKGRSSKWAGMASGDEDSRSGGAGAGALQQAPQQQPQQVLLGDQNIEARAAAELDAMEAPAASDFVRSVAANPAVRIGFVSAVALAAVSAMHNQGFVQQAVASCEGLQCMVGVSAKEGVWKLLFGLLGFLSYKVALVGVAIAPSQDSAGTTSPGAKQ